MYSGAIIVQVTMVLRVVVRCAGVAGDIDEGHR